MTTEQMNYKIQEFKNITQEMLETYSRKNVDYDDAFTKSLKEDGLLVAKIRLGDKYNRLVSLLKQKKNGTIEESLRDTLIDLANYAIMNVMWMDNQKKQIATCGTTSEIREFGFTGTSSTLIIK